MLLLAFRELMRISHHTMAARLYVRVTSPTYMGGAQKRLIRSPAPPLLTTQHTHKTHNNSQQYNCNTQHTTHKTHNKQNTQPPTTNHQPPATSHQPPATSNQPPATSNQQQLHSHFGLSRGYPQRISAAWGTVRCHLEQAKKVQSSLVFCVLDS